MRILVPVVIFLLGISVGSFLTALLWRLRTHESWAIARSYCPSCRTTLGWKDLVPLISFVILGGKCRHCSKGISWQYPLIELVTGLLFLASYYFGSGSYALLLRDWIAIAVLVAVFVFDLRYSLIPRALVLPTSVVVLFLSGIAGAGVVSPLLAAVIASGFFGVQYVVSNGRWIGLGDVTLGIFMGCVLGFPNVLVALFLAYLLGAAVAVFLLAMKKKTWKTEIPFGTFLAVGSVIAMLFGDVLVQWYLSLV